MAIPPEDIIAIKRAFNTGGRDRALAEVRRRYPSVTDWTAPGVLARILKMTVEPPARFQPDGPRGKPKGEA